MVGNKKNIVGMVLFGMFAASALCMSSALAQQRDPVHGPVFAVSDHCIACHSNLTDSKGNDISIGYSWRAAMMANSARDPYWHAGVRREVMDHPEARAAIEDKCSTCHMPMGRTMAFARGAKGVVFDHVQGVAPVPEETVYAWDGVSCTVCHQIEPDNFGDHESFDGGYIVGGNAVTAGRVYGPFAVDHGHQRIMQSASAFTPDKALHIQESELCATCHTLFTAALDGSGNVVAQFPEQVPYLEWEQSAYRESRSCQDCHMPTVPGSASVSSVLGEPRDAVSQHTFRGANAFMLGILDQYRDELNVETPSADLQAAVARAVEHLATRAAQLTIESAEFRGAELIIDLRIKNLAGHKLPTAYPSRRAWLNVIVTDQDGAALFESGAPMADGSIAHNDNDQDGMRFEPHYDEIVSEDQVQIYEPIIYDYKDEVTTGLLYGVRYAKDNRLLPAGFDKSNASDDIAVRGGAVGDDNFLAGGDHIRYRVAVEEEVDSVQVTARLMYQSIGYRWAQNLRTYDAFETRRFVGYYEANAGQTATLVAETRSGRVQR